MTAEELLTRLLALVPADWNAIVTSTAARWMDGLQVSWRVQVYRTDVDGVEVMATKWDTPTRVLAWAADLPAMEWTVSADRKTSRRYVPPVTP
jgi:hypothetical protein